ncbi:Isochorismatase hydrolase [Ascobolus immersus RN42]|uniref:nicotinamidase n=1 Tax=Ascobolus immersus RN42 TaxID=1160509 RepID=A0A3N4I5K8_ASCIM|nr:Isochorismatase hydrolase [Ascobolus immersus RN42]
MTPTPFHPALIVVDIQEDFLPPNGSLAVPNGLDIIPPVNALLELPFRLKVATKDNHPPTHISFCTSHAPPHNVPFSSTYTLVNPRNPEEKIQSRLWPQHCVQGTKGWEFPESLEVGRLDEMVLKGSDEKVEQYSGFAGPFRGAEAESSGEIGDAPDETELRRILVEGGVTHVYVVGLALDYCVKATALHAVERGFKTYVIREGTRAVDAAAVEEVYKELEEKGVGVISSDSEEVEWVKQLEK